MGPSKFLHCWQIQFLQWCDFTSLAVSLLYNTVVTITTSQSHEAVASTCKVKVTDWCGFMREVASPYFCRVLLRSCLCQNGGDYPRCENYWRWGLSDATDGLPRGGRGHAAQPQWERDDWVCGAVWTLMGVQGLCFSLAVLMRNIAPCCRICQHLVGRCGFMCAPFQTFQGVMMACSACFQSHSCGEVAWGSMDELCWSYLGPIVCLIGN